MQSPLLELNQISEQTASSQLWEAAQLSLKLGRVNQSLNLAYTAVCQDRNRQQQYQAHYLQALQLGAELAEEIEDYPKAAYYWEQLTQQQPQNAEFWYGLGVAKANLQDYRSAATALDRCLQLQPQHTKARSHRQKIQQLLA